MDEGEVVDEGSNDAKQQPLDLKSRTLELGVRVIRLFDALPRHPAGQVIGKQILRSATAVGAIYREGCRSRSDAEFISKMENALQELEETRYWLELMLVAEFFSSERLNPLQDEVRQLIAIFTTCVKKVKSRQPS